MKKVCPKCGGSTGFEYRDPAVLVYWGAWGSPRGDWECNIEHQNELPKTVRCYDCGRRIRREDVDGL